MDPMTSAATRARARRAGRAAAAYAQPALCRVAARRSGAIVAEAQATPQGQARDNGQRGTIVSLLASSPGFEHGTRPGNASNRRERPFRHSISLAVAVASGRSPRAHRRWWAHRRRLWTLWPGSGRIPI